jgi:NADPH:quinone reductase-like Zn-dependent oxidoreductase
MPDGVSFAEAATLPHSALLAIQGFRLRDGRTPLPGDKVLVGGASGNVGPFAVQVAKALGTEVTAVASTPKLDFVRALGADRVIDYTITDYTSTGDRYDWILDTDTHYPAVRVRRALKPGGVYVSLGGGDTRIIDVLVIAPVVGRATGKHMGLMLWWKPFAERDVLELKRLIASGAVRPAIDRHYSLAEVRDALRYVDDGKPKGKVVIDVAG